MKTCLVLLVALFVVAGAFAQEQAGDAGTEDMMAKLAELMAPGAEHALLGKLAGEWDVTARWWAAKGSPAVESKATSSVKWILSNRFLQTDYSMDMMGVPVHGFGLDGFDTVKRKFTKIWLDEMSTATYTAEGDLAADGKTIMYMGRRDDPLTGARDLDIRYVETIIDDNRHVFQIIEYPGTPKEYVSVEMTYTRK